MIILSGDAFTLVDGSSLLGHHHDRMLTALAAAERKRLSVVGPSDHLRSVTPALRANGRHLRPMFGFVVVNHSVLNSRKLVASRVDSIKALKHSYFSDIWTGDQRKATCADSGQRLQFCKWASNSRL